MDGPDRYSLEMVAMPYRWSDRQDVPGNSMIHAFQLTAASVYRS